MRPLKRYKHNLSHDHLGTYEMGPLYPNLLIETLPGDSFEIVTESMSRFEAMTSATFSRIDKFQYYFYIPKRLLFADYYDYRYGGKDGTDSTVPPYMIAPVGGYPLGSLADYFGLPTGVENFKHSAMPFRGYELILNDWFLNDHLDTFFDVKTTPGLDTTTNTSLQNKKWEKDRFTSALPSSQLTQNPVYLPMGIDAPVSVYGTGKSLGLTDDLQLGVGLTTASSVGVIAESQAFNVPVGTSVSNAGMANLKAIGVTPVASDSGLAGTADLSIASAVTIPQLRTSIVVQQFLERLNRCGTRDVEATLSTFGVRIPDYRLDRSSYLGGSRTPVMITPVEQTSESATTPQGTLTGRGISAGTTGCKCFCYEDGFIIGLVCYIPRTSYSQGLDKMWTRETRYDEFLPDFQGIGDQEVKIENIYTQSDSVVDASGTPRNKLTFGYEGRYNEFRHMYSKVHGQYRPGGTMEDHTLTRNFENEPQLNSQFVTADPSTRIFAVTSGVDHIEAQFFHHIRAYRPVKLYGNPGVGKV